jgi:hypothetical protein
MSYDYDFIGNMTYKSDIGSYSYDTNNVKLFKEMTGDIWSKCADKYLKEVF